MSTEPPNQVTLQPCPFCGSAKAMPLPADRDSEERLFPIVRCMGCFTDVPGNNDDFSFDAKSAIKAWNTRVTSTPDWEGLIKKLEAVAAYGEISILDATDIIQQHAAEPVIKFMGEVSPVNSGAGRIQPAGETAPSPARSEISLKKCVEAASEEITWGMTEMMPDVYKRRITATTKAVLDAAGVKYVD
jgi:hypothetical protein